MGQSESIQVFVKTPSRRTLTLDLERSTKVEDIKARITVEEGIDPSEQQLFFGDKELENDLSISSYNIQDKSTLILVRLQPSPFLSRIWKIYVEPPTGERVSLDVTTSTTIGEIKNEFVRVTNDTRKIISLSKDYLCLVFNRYVLDDMKSLSHYNIHPGSTLLLKEKAMSVNISMPSGRTVTLNVTPSTTIERVKEMIQQQEGIPIERQLLSTLDRHHQLGSGDRVSSCSNRYDYCRLSLRIKAVMSAPENIVIIVNTKAIPKLIVLDVASSDTIQSIKAKIQEKEGTPSDQQELTFRGNPLENHHTLSHYDLTSQSTINLLNEWVQVKTPTGGTVRVSLVFGSTLIREMKTRILDADTEAQAQDDDQQLVLFNKGYPLDDDETVSPNISVANLHCIRMKHYEKLIVVRLSLNRKVFRSLVVTPLATVQEMKGMIDEDIPPGYQLFLGDKRLADTQTLAECLSMEQPMQQYPVLELLMPISVAFPSGKRKNFFVAPFDTVEDLKQSLYGTSLSSVVQVTFSGSQLEDRHLLTKYNIQPESTLFVHESDMDVIIRSGAIHNLSLPVTPSTTVMEIKSMI